MQKTFEYLRVQTAMDTYDAEDIGNLIIQALNDEGLEWYLYIHTDTGYTTIKELGPLMGSSETIPKNNFMYYCHRQEYDERKLTKIINTFLNNPKREITQVADVEEDVLQDKLTLIRKIL